MTSSLVGSEMCIRDSTILARGSKLEGQGQPSRTLRSGQWICVHCTLPVSYTHLTLPTICSV
eukprot:11779694-Prorocentrum_lima.AAC.1